MNKKKLSVVMAGAMLATSVAPVMAAETTVETMAMDQRGLLLDAVRELMKDKMLTGTEAKYDSAVGITVSKKGESDKNADGKIVNFVNDLKEVEKLLRAGWNTDKTIRVYEKETTVNKYGELTDKSQEDVEVPGKELVAKESNLRAMLNADYANNKFVDKVEAVNEKVDGETVLKGVKITLNVSVDAANGSSEQKVITLSLGDKLLDLDAPMDANNKALHNTDSDVQKFDHFAVKLGDKEVITAGKELEGRTLLQEINLVGEAEGAKDSLLVSDLFDGLMLTNKGVKLLEALKADEKLGKDLDFVILPKSGLLPGIYGFDIKVNDNKNHKNDRVITVRGLDKNDADILMNWLLKEEFNVGVLAGDNRYETAVKIAKEQAKITKVAENGHVVLVNGNALVDGLAAAPLAASLVKNPKTAAPILLTSKDSIPAETLAYLKELVREKRIQNLDDITIDIVGGEGVISKNVADTLEGIGFTVVRYSGENREETSLEVFDSIKENGRDTIYVVGAKGEADAMSIAPVAAENGTIIVSNFGGLSKVALKTIEKAKQNIVIVGGEAVVSAADEAKLAAIAKENKTTIKRVAGADRKATNAAIIKEYYKFGKADVDAVMVAKDNVLVDALTAANLASKLQAPIVLATNSLSKEQINELNLKAKDAKALYQIGGGVNRNNVVVKLAELLGLPTEIQ